MSSLSAIPDSNPTRAQLRLVVLGQWVRAGLELARGARAGRGLVGGAIVLWQVFQAVRLAILLARRLSEARHVPSPVAPETAPGETADGGHAPAQGLEFPANDPSSRAACLRHALIELTSMIRQVLDLASDRRGRSGAVEANGAVVAPELRRPKSRCGRPLDRPPRPERRRQSCHTPIAA